MYLTNKIRELEVFNIESFESQDGIDISGDVLVKNISYYKGYIEIILSGKINLSGTICETISQISIIVSDIYTYGFQHNFFLILRGLKLENLIIYKIRKFNMVAFSGLDDLEKYSYHSYLLGTSQISEGEFQRLKDKDDEFRRTQRERIHAYLNNLNQVGGDIELF